MTTRDRLLLLVTTILSFATVAISEGWFPGIARGTWAAWIVGAITAVFMIIVGGKIYQDLARREAKMSDRDKAEAKRLKRASVVLIVLAIVVPAGLGAWLKLSIDDPPLWLWAVFGGLLFGAWELQRRALRVK